MQYKDFIAEIAEERDIPAAQADQIVRHVFTNIATSLAEGEDVGIPGFGKFRAVDRAARTAHNPQTGETVEVAAKTVVKFKAASALNDLLN